MRHWGSLGVILSIPARCIRMLLIFAALKEEVSGILQAGDAREVPTPDGFRAFSGNFDNGRPGAQFMTVTSGVGHLRAQAAANWAINNVKDPKLLVVGFAGGTRAALRRGDLVIPTTVSHIEGSPITWNSEGMSEPISPDAHMLSCARVVVEMAGIDSASGLLVSLPSIARTANMKSWIGDRLSVAAVDLESHTVCAIAAKAGIPFLVVRSIVDVMDYNLPPLVVEISQGPSDRRVWPTVKYLTKRPWQLPTLIELKGAARTARGTLTRFCREFSNEIDGTAGGRTRAGVGG